LISQYRSAGPLALSTGTAAIFTAAEFNGTHSYDREHIRLTVEDEEEICLNAKRIRANKWPIGSATYIPCRIDRCGHFFKTSEFVTANATFTCQHHPRGIQTRESCGREYDSSQAADIGVHFQENQFFSAPGMFRRKKGPGPYDKNAEIRLIIKFLRIAGDNVRFDEPLAQRRHWHYGERLVAAYGDDRDNQFIEAEVTSLRNDQVLDVDDSSEPNTVSVAFGFEAGLSFLEPETSDLDDELANLYERLRRAAGVGITSYGRFDEIPIAEKSRVLALIPPGAMLEFQRLWDGLDRSRAALEAGINPKTQASRLKVWKAAIGAAINQNEKVQAELMVECFEKCFHKMRHDQKVALRETGGWFLHLKQKNTPPEWIYLGTEEVDSAARDAAIQKHCRKILKTKDPDVDGIIDRIDAEFEAGRRIWVAPMTKAKS
jgi:hypothetical protein